MSKIREILRLYTQGQSNKKINELTASSRNTVKKYIHKFIHERLTYEVISGMSDHELDLHFGYIEPAVKDERFEQLQRLLPDMEKQMKRRGMTITLVWEQYRVISIRRVMPLRSFINTIANLPNVPSLSFIWSIKPAIRLL